MSAARVPLHERWGYDLTTVEGSEAFEQEFNRRKAIAEEFHGGDFGEIQGLLDDIDRLMISVLTISRTTTR